VGAGTYASYSNTDFEKRIVGYESEAALLCLVNPKLAKAGKEKINSLLDDIKL
jgi:hypothetical protein